jgi:hypothetical protein
MIDYRNSSFIPLTSNANGKISWSKPLQSSEQPRFLLLWNDKIIVESLNEIALFSAKGSQLLIQDKAYGTFMTVKENNIYFINKDYQLQTLDNNKKINTLNEYLPEAPDNRFPVSIIIPQGQNYLAVVQSLGGVHEPPPQVFINQTKYGDGLSTWEQEYEGSQKIDPLYILKVKRIIIFITETIIIDSESGKEIRKIPFLRNNLSVCSADEDSNLYFAGKDKNNIVLLSETLDGNLLWQSEEIPVSFNEKILKPPIITNKIIFLLTSASLYAFEKGKVLWTFNKPDLELKSCTSLEDRSTLLTTSNLLFHLDESGNVIFKTELTDNILTPPIVNTKGEILLATEKNLVCIN